MIFLFNCDRILNCLKEGLKLKRNIDGIVYVQKIDINLLHSLNLPIPNSEYTDKLIRGEELIDESNVFEFVSFVDDKAKEYFNNLNWIFDFDYLLTLPSDKIFELRLKLMEEREMVGNKYALAKDNTLEKEKLLNQSKILDLQLYSLDDLLMFASGCVYCKVNNNHNANNNNIKSNNGIVKLVKSLFNSKKKVV